MKKIFGLIGGVAIVALSAMSCTFAYTQEQQEAYQWAYNYGITTQPTIEAANLEGNITRQAFAKMVINYLENAVGGKQTVLNSCSFPDENKITEDLKEYAKKTCEYGIMGSGGFYFEPMNFLTKAQLGTILSRIVWGNVYNNSGELYYVYHLYMLRENGIMDTIDNPDEYARRGDVLIMLKRMYEKFELNILNKDPSYNYIKEINQLNNNNIPDELIEQLYNIDISLYGKNIEYDNGEWKIYYSSGQLEAKGYFKNGELDGEIITYYENGQLEAKGYFKNGELDGEMIAYYENGQLRGKGYFKNGEPDGEIITYYENGKIESKEFYKNGEYDGEQLEYYENGQLKSKENYKDGREDGEQLEYYENGQLKSKENYKDGREDGEQLEYYENGQLRSKENYKDGREDGEQLEYYENGQLESKENYKNGLEDGEFIAYYENGQLRVKLVFKDGDFSGEFIYYYENGQIYKKGYIDNSKETGEWIFYYEDGQVQTIGHFKDGMLDGEIIAYYENGNVKATGNYKDDKEDGKFVYYYEDGQINLEINFKNGMLDGEYIHRFEDGKITKMNFKDGKEDGKEIGYYEDGSIRFLRNFKDGIGTKSYYNKDGSLIGTGDETYTDEFDEENGTYKSILNGLEIGYHENGQLKEISYYKDGELDGIQTIYYENGQIESTCNYTNGMEGLCTRYDEDGEEISTITTYGGIIDVDSSEKNGAILKNIPLNHGILQLDLGIKESKGTVNKEGKLDIENWGLENNNEEKIPGK